MGMAGPCLVAVFIFKLTGCFWQDLSEYGDERPSLVGAKFYPTHTFWFVCAEAQKRLMFSALNVLAYA